MNENYCSEGTGSIDGRIVSLNFYPNESVTCDYLSDSGALFSHVPLSQVSFYGKSRSWRDYLPNDKDSFINCPDGHGNISLYSYHQKDFLEPVLIKFINDRRNSQMFGKGKYLATLDFIDGNEMVHIIYCQNVMFADGRIPLSADLDLIGRVMFIPSHKILFKGQIKDEKLFKIYKKLPSTVKAISC